MTKRDRIKDMVERIKEHIENAQSGFDVQDSSFAIKYKDGKIEYISGYDFSDKISLNVSKITYVVANDSYDGWDSEQKSWFEDFAHGDTSNTESFGLWNEYVNSMLYK